MDITLQTFQYIIQYTINKSDTEIIIQILKDTKVDAEQSYTIDQLKEIAAFFYMFCSVQSVYNELVSLTSKSNVVIKEGNDFYTIVLNINFKEISTMR